jgi:hypothetical protein
MGKINKVISLQNLSADLIELLQKKYPDGYHNHVIKVTTPKNEVFWGVTLDTPEISYLVKVPVKIDTNPDEIEEKDYDEDSSITPDENFSGDNAEDFENVPDEDN